MRQASDPWKARTLYFSRSSLLNGALMITRRTLDGAEKCALRDFRLEEWTSGSSSCQYANSSIRVPNNYLYSLLVIAILIVLPTEGGIGDSVGRFCTRGCKMKIGSNFFCVR